MNQVGLVFLGSVVTSIIVLGGLTLVEMLFPRERHSLKARARGVVFWMLTLVFSTLVAATLAPLWKSLQIRPLLTLEVERWFAWAGPFAGLLISLIVVLVTDFFGYWFHRIQHGPLWRFHAIHHSIEKMNAVNSYGFAGDTAFQFALMTIPMSLIPFGPYDAPLYLTVWLAFQAVFLHSPTTLHYGWLGQLLSDNRYHRIHHSLEPRHFNKNYGTMTTVWDRVFGTAYFPAKDEWPDTGLSDVAEPRTIKEYLDLPLRFGRRQPVEV